MNELRDVCLFLIKIYIKPWFECTNAINAPWQDLIFIKNSIKYADADSIISTTVLNKMSNHLWYLSKEAAALAFFDSRVSFKDKRKMVEKLKSKAPNVKLICI